MATLQPLSRQFAIVNADGTPNDYFIRWAQQKQIDINNNLTAAQVQALIDATLDDYSVHAGFGLSGGGPLNTNPTIDLNASIGELNDVDLSTPPTDQQVLVWDAASSLWVPADQSGGGGSAPTFWYVNATGTGASQGVTIPYTVSDDQSILVFVNGIFYEQDEYSVSGTTVTLTTNAAGDSIEIRGFNGGGGGGGSTSNFYPPAASSFASVASNGVQPTFTDTDFGMSVDFKMFTTNPIGKMAYIMLPSPTTDWTCDILYEMSAYTYDIRGGVAFYETATGKTFGLAHQNSNNANAFIIQTGMVFTNATVNLGSTQATVPMSTSMAQIRGFRLRYDLATDRYYFQVSPNGGAWIPEALNTGALLSATRASQFTTRADAIGFWVRNGANASTGWNAAGNIPYLKFS